MRRGRPAFRESPAALQRQIRLTLNAAAEIELLIRARYPLLYVVTPEEARVHAVLEGIARRGQKKVFDWSCSTGVVASGTSIQSAKHRNAPTKDPILALDQVIDQVEPALFVFHDFHHFLAKPNHAVIRKLKEIAQHLKSSHKTIILVSPVMEVPPDLEKEITLVTFPLPQREEIGELLDRIVLEIKAGGRVRIDLDPAGRDRLLHAALGLTLNETENVLAKILVKSERLSAEDVDEVFSEKQQIIRKNGLLEYYTTRESLEHLGGMPILKDWLKKRAAAFTPEARAFGLPAPKGLLLLGVQGCGKSLCAKAVASLWQMPLLRFDVGRMFGSLVGSSEENVRRAIAVAESVAPAVLWVDEIDKAFSGFQSSALTDSGTTARVFGTFVTWLSEKAAPVFVVATANDISQLPPELMRKGRFDEMFFVDLPLEKERQEIFSIHLARRGRDPHAFRIAKLAAASPNFSGAEIEQAIVSALYDAFYERTELSTDHILRALEQSVPLASTMDEQINELRTWAEGRARFASTVRH